MRNHPQVTVVVVTYRGAAFLAECLLSMASQTIPHQLIVVDNASSDGTRAILENQFPSVRVIRSKTNTGFSGGIALGMAEVQTPLVAFLNDDARADPQWLAALVTALEQNPQAAAVTSQMWLCDPPETLNNLGVAMTSAGYGYDIGLHGGPEIAYTRTHSVFGFSGGAAMCRIEPLRGVGGSPHDFFLYYEDVDMSWRLRLSGYQILSVPEARVWHLHSATVGQRSPEFHRYNERNRLVTLFRCAPAAVFGRELLRFAITTGSLALKRLTRRPIPPSGNFSVSLRLRVLGEIVLRSPRHVAARRAIGRRAVIDRRLVARQWLGANPFEPAVSKTGPEISTS